VRRSGVSRRRCGGQRQREEQFRRIPDAARLKEYMEAMAGESHVAGQPSSKKVADYALAKFKSFGLDARLEEFEAMMPWPIETSVELVAPEKYTLRVKEPVSPRTGPAIRRRSTTPTPETAT
jgi:N-acetylated-alpha-linked acidic dipeptidase